MIGVLARESGQLMSTVADEPYINARLAFEQALELRRFDSVNRLGERVDLAEMFAMARHDPKALEKVHHRYEDLAGLIPTIAETKAAALRMLEESGDHANAAKIRAVMGGKP